MIVSALLIWFRITTAVTTPAIASGPEPAKSQSARWLCTVPSRRWRTAPNDLKIAPWKMSVPTAYGLEAEDDDQDRGHQRAAADSGQADEQPQPQARDRELPGHVRRPRPLSAARTCSAASSRERDVMSRRMSGSSGGS